jgi:hypothetical protein
MTTNTFRSVNEAPRGFNHRIVVDHTDLTTSANNTTQSITLVTLPAGTVVKSAAYWLKTPFKLSTNSSFDLTTMIVGDSGDTDRYIPSRELNENGTEIVYSASHVGSNTTLPFVTTDSTAVAAVFTPKAANNLAQLDTGEIHIYLETADVTTLS